MKEIRVVSAELVVDCRVRYKQVWDAVRLLSTLPPDKAVSVPTDVHSPNTISKKAHVYARRYRMQVVTRQVGNEVVICERRNEKKASMGELAKRCMQNASDRFVRATNAGFAG